MFADDTLLYCTDQTLDGCLHSLQNEVSKVAEWFRENKLTLNVAKTNTMLSGTRQRLNGAATNESLGIRLNDALVLNTSEYTYLGVRLDTHITWCAHVDKICKTLSSRVGMLQRVKDNFSPS